MTLIKHEPLLFILAAEPSADLHGAKLIRELLKKSPSLRICAVAGPLMRALPIETLFEMESLQVMGFIDVLFALPKLVRLFFTIRDKILALNPQTVICIDYPGFNLRLERSLRKKGFSGKLVHFVCPTVWAWGKKRIPLMEKNLDLLLTVFPFEKSCFAKSSLRVEYVGHPLTQEISPHKERRQKILALFPGSRRKEIERNLPLQLRVAKRLALLDKELSLAVSVAHPDKEPLIRELSSGLSVTFVPFEERYALMQRAHASLATSGTVTLELALHATPTVCGFAITAFDLFLAQKVFKINLPFYCIVNIIASRAIFPELFGPHFTEEKLFFHGRALWFEEERRQACLEGCREVRQLLGHSNASQRAAELILN